LLLLSVCIGVASGLQYTPFGSGITFSEGPNPCRVLVAYGGYLSGTSETQTWIEALRVAFFEKDASSLGINTFFAVKGPASSTYSGHEISNSKITNWFVNNNAKCAGQNPLAIIIAHSSGGFVAGEFVSQMGAASAQLSSWNQRIVYYDLDGATTGWTPAAQKLMMRYLVVAKMSSGLRSANYGIINSGNAATNIILDSSNSGCKAPFCVHMTLITLKPHFPNTWNIADVRGLTDPAHPVQIQYFKQTLAKLISVAGTPAAPPTVAEFDEEELPNLDEANLENEDADVDEAPVAVAEPEHVQPREAHPEHHPQHPEHHIAAHPHPHSHHDCGKKVAVNVEIAA